MADPTKFTPSYDFSDYQASNSSSPLPGAQVDIQLSDIKRTTDETIDALKQVRRSDGKIANRSIGADQLADSLAIGFTLRGSWVEDDTYYEGDGAVFGEAFYKARVTAVATAENRPDLDPDTWTFLLTFSTLAVTDSSITPPKLASGEEDGFLAKIGVWAKLGALIAGGTAKTAPLDADLFALSDSAAASATKKLTWANIKASLKTYFDGLYDQGLFKIADIDVGGVVLVDCVDARIASCSSLVIVGEDLQPVSGTGAYVLFRVFNSVGQVSGPLYVDLHKRWTPSGEGVGGVIGDTAFNLHRAEPISAASQALGFRLDVTKPLSGVKSRIFAKTMGVMESASALAYDTQGYVDGGAVTGVRIFLSTSAAFRSGGRIQVYGMR